MLKRKRKVGRPSKKEIQREKNIKFLGAVLIIVLIGVLFYNIKNYIKDNPNKVQASVNYTCPSGYTYVDYLYTKSGGEYKGLNNRCVKVSEYTVSSSACVKGTPSTFCVRGADGKLHKLVCKKGSALGHTSKYGVKCYSGTKAKEVKTTTKYDISGATVSPILDQVYTGSKIKPLPYVTYNGTVLTKGDDYKLQYSNNKAVGIAKVKIVGIGNFTGEKIIEFRIIKNTSNTQPTTKKEETTPSTTVTPGKVKIKIDVNGGKVNTNSYGYTQSGSLVLQNGKDVIDSVKYGSTLGKYGLTDPNSKTKLNISRKGYKIVKNKEYKCKSGCTKSGRIYDEETRYKASDFCDASKGDCTVILEVNWKKK